jgi:hypothetical protein
MQVLDITDNTQRVISKESLVVEEPPQKLSNNKKVIIAFSIFLIVGACIGLIIGLYFHFSPSSVHLLSTASVSNDGISHLSTKFQFIDNDLSGDNINDNFTVMFADLTDQPLQSSQLRRFLQGGDQKSPILDVSLHYTHDSGIKILIRNGQIVNISVPIDQVVQYYANQSDAVSRLLQEQEDPLLYPNEDSTV